MVFSSCSCIALEIILILVNVNKSCCIIVRKLLAQISEILWANLSPSRVYRWNIFFLSCSLREFKLSVSQHNQYHMLSLLNQASLIKSNSIHLPWSWALNTQTVSLSSWSIFYNLKYSGKTYLKIIGYKFPFDVFLIQYIDL